MASYAFHPEASTEYLEATRYYLDHASPLVAAAFVAEIEAAIKSVLALRVAWRVVEEPEIRRYYLKRFPYSLYYRWEIEHDRVSIYAVMHSSRLPGYWHHRLD